jgi:RNA polymerase sigma-B factor
MFMASTTVACCRAPQQVFEHYHRERSPADREWLVEHFLPLAHHLARRYRPHSDREDVDQVAAVGLLKAIDRYDPDRGVAFTSFAVPTILGEIKRYFRDLGWAVRVPRDLQELALQAEGVTERLTGRLGRAPTAAEVAEACETTVERVLDARGTQTAHFADSLDVPASSREDSDAPLAELRDDEAGFQYAEWRADIDHLLATLSERDQQILRLRFYGDLTQSEIADRLGLSQMQVSRLLRRSLETLHEQTNAG